MEQTEQMKPETVKQYRAELTLPQTLHTITSNDLNKLQGQVRIACKAENLNPTFDKEQSNNTLFIWDDEGRQLGHVIVYDVYPEMSVSQTVNARKQAQRAA